MKNLYSILSLLGLSLLFTNCVGPKSLQKQINRTAYEPILILDSEQVTEKSDKTIAFEIVNESPLTPGSTVFKNDGHFLYLLIFYTYEYDMTITLGDNASNPSALGIMENALYGTFDRSGILQRQMPSDSSVTDYRALVTVKEVDIKCDYINKGFGFWSFSSSEASAQKSQGKVVTNLKLYDKEGNLLLEKDYTKHETTEFASTTTNYSLVRKMAMKNLVENLTLSSQDIALQLTHDINNALMPAEEFIVTSEEVIEAPEEQQ